MKDPRLLPKTPHIYPPPITRRRLCEGRPEWSTPNPPEHARNRLTHICHHCPALTPLRGLPQSLRRRQTPHRWRYRRTRMGRHRPRHLPQRPPTHPQNHSHARRLPLLQNLRTGHPTPLHSSTTKGTHPCHVTDNIVYSVRQSHFFRLFPREQIMSHYRQ